MSKRLTAGVLGVLAILCGMVGLGYWLLPLSIGAFWLGADFLKFAISGRPFRIPPWVRAVIVSLLSFFPGFLLGLFPLLLYEVHRDPNDSQAAIRAFVIAAVIGAASVLAVGFVLLRRTKPGIRR